MAEIARVQSGEDLPQNPRPDWQEQIRFPMPYLLRFRRRHIHVSIVLPHVFVPVVMFIEDESSSHASGLQIVHLTLAHHSSDASQQPRSLSLRSGRRRCRLRALDPRGRVRR